MQIQEVAFGRLTAEPGLFVEIDGPLLIDDRSQRVANAMRANGKGYGGLPLVFLNALAG